MSTSLDAIARIFGGAAQPEPNHAPADEARAAVAASPEVWRSLIECATCRTEMSVLAAQCPKCGAPNDWVHPLISGFKASSRDINIGRPFTFEATSHQVKGEAPLFAAPPLRLVAALIMLLGFVVAVFALVAGSMLWFFVLCGVAGAFPVALLHLGSARPESFSFDLRSGEWASTNETLWWPVQARLRPGATKP